MASESSIGVPGESADTDEVKSRRYTITQLSKEFGVTARTLRFYEDKGLLHPARRGQSRIFSYRDRGTSQADPSGQAGWLLPDRNQGNA